MHVFFETTVTVVPSGPTAPTAMTPPRLTAATAVPVCACPCVPRRACASARTQTLARRALTIPAVSRTMGESATGEAPSTFAEHSSELVSFESIQVVVEVNRAD